MDGSMEREQGSRIPHDAPDPCYASLATQPQLPKRRPLVAGEMLTYPSDHRGYPPQHVAVPTFSTAAAPFTVDGLHPADQTFPNPNLDAPSVTPLYAAGEWGNASWMEAPVRYMARDAAASASPGFSGHYHLNKDPSGPATSPIDGALSFPVKSLTSESIPGNISCRATEAEESAHTQILTKEGQEHSHCHPDAKKNLLQMSDSSSSNQATFLKLIHNLSVVLLSTCNGGSSLQEYEEGILKSVIRNLKAASSKGGKATLKGDDCLKDCSQISCLRNNLLMAIPEHSSESTDSEFKTSISQALSKLPEDNILNDTEVSQVSIYKKIWFEAEASVCKLKYKLQHARMKLAKMKVFHNTQTAPVDLSESDKASRVTLSDGQPHNHAKDCNSCAATLQCHGEGIDGRQSSSVINRVTTQQSTCVLAAQVPAASPVPPPPALVPQPYTVAPDNPSGPYCGNCHKLGLSPHLCYKKNDQGHNIFSGTSSPSGPCQSSSTGQELLTQPPPPPPSDILSPRSIIATNKSIVHGLYAEIFAQMKVLESRTDVSSLGESKCEVQQEPSKGSYPVENDVLARLRILKSRPDYITSLGLESNNHQLDTSINASDEVHEMFARLKVLESRIDKISSLGDNKCEEQEKGSEGSYPVEDAVLARLHILKSRADDITSLGLESSKQQLNARTGVAGEVEDAIMARLGSLKSHPDVEASSIGVVEGGKEDPCAVGLWISGRQPLPSPPALSEKTTLPSEVSGESPAILISSSDKAPALCTLKHAPSVMEKDHSGPADDALHSAPLLSVPQEAWGLAQKTAKVKRHPHGPAQRRFRLPSTIKIKQPISEQRALAILLRRLGMIRKDEVDEQAIDRLLAVLGASFPKSLLQAIFCGSDLVKGTPGESWGISVRDVIF